MSAVNDKALSKFVGKLYVAPAASPSAFVRLASVRGLIANIDNTTQQVEVKTDDCGTVFKGYIPEIRLEGEFLENFDRDTMNLILGGTPTDVAGTPVPVTGEAHGTGWTQGTPIQLDHKNGANTVVASIVVKGGGSTLALNTDYRVFVGDGETGVLGYTYITPIAAQAGAITVDYTYTPNSSEKIVYSQVFTEAQSLVVKIEAEDPANALHKRILTLATATFEGTYGLNFVDIVEAGDIKGTTFVFKGDKGSTFTVENQIL